MSLRSVYTSTLFTTQVLLVQKLVFGGYPGQSPNVSFGDVVDSLDCFVFSSLLAYKAYTSLVQPFQLHL